MKILQELGFSPEYATLCVKLKSTYKQITKMIKLKKKGYSEDDAFEEVYKYAGY